MAQMDSRRRATSVFRDNATRFPARGIRDASSVQQQSSLSEKVHRRCKKKDKHEQKNSHEFQVPSYCSKLLSNFCAYSTIGVWTQRRIGYAALLAPTMCRCLTGPTY